MIVIFPGTPVTPWKCCGRSIKHFDLLFPAPPRPLPSALPASLRTLGTLSLSPEHGSCATLHRPEKPEALLRPCERPAPSGAPRPSPAQGREQQEQLRGSGCLCSRRRCRCLRRCAVRWAAAGAAIRQAGRRLAGPLQFSCIQSFTSLSDWLLVFLVCLGDGAFLKTKMMRILYQHSTPFCP